MKRIAALLLLACGIAQNAAAFDSFQVSDIRIDGLSRIAAGTVFTYLPVEKGDTLTASSADQFNYQFKGDDAYLREVLRKYPELFKADPEKPMSLRRAPAEPAP